MIVVDTNVLSELMRGESHPAVLAWVAACAALHDTHQPDRNPVPHLQRCPKDAGEQHWRLRPMCCSPKISPGGSCHSKVTRPRAIPKIVLARRQAGSPIEKFDALIAATALAAGASIATRDVGGFTDCGLTVIDTWRS